MLQDLVSLNKSNLLNSYYDKLTVMKNIYFLIVFSLLSSSLSFSQVAINPNGAAPNASAGLDVNFTDKGFLLPRMNFEQRNAIQNPAEGLIIYCTDCSTDATGALSIYQGGIWRIFNLNCYSPNKPSQGSRIPSLNQIIWNWDAVPIALGYKWNTTNNYNTAIDLGNCTTRTETGLSCWTPYTRYVWAYNSCGQCPELILRDTTSMIPFSPAPTGGNHASNASMITWAWNYVSGATGYKWNTTNNFNTAVDMGNAVLYLEQGLSCKAVARKAGIDPEHLAQLESADRCSFDEVKKLYIALGLSLPDGCKKRAPS